MTFVKLHVIAINFIPQKSSESYLSAGLNKVGRNNSQ
jgi:hypothetical protein